MHGNIPYRQLQIITTVLWKYGLENMGKYGLPQVIPTQPASHIIQHLSCFPTPISNCALLVVCVFVYVPVLHQQQHSEESLSLSGYWLPSAMIRHHRGTNRCTETQISLSPSHITHTLTRTHTSCTVTAVVSQLFAFRQSQELLCWTAPAFSPTKRIHLIHFKHSILY